MSSNALLTLGLVGKPGNGLFNELTVIDSLIDPAASGLRMHGGKVQRFVRREILATRNDFYRHNMVFRGYEVGRWTVLAIRKHKQGKDWQQGDFDKSDSVASSGFAKVFNSSWLR